MELLLNDQNMKTEAKTVAELIQELELEHRPVVVEIDGTVVYRDQWQTTSLVSGMRIELVQFVGGG